MTFEQRQAVRAAVAAVQRARERRTRRMHVRTLYGAKLYLGGASSPDYNSHRVGYPPSRPDGNLTSS
jgi:hypothetical protein